MSYNNNDHERHTYPNTILVEKPPMECVEIVRIKLSQDKLVNDQFVKIFKDLAFLQKNYVQNLKKIISENENFNKIINDKMLSNNVVDEYELKNLSNFESLSSGTSTNVAKVYSALIDDLSKQAKLHSKIYQNLEDKIIKDLYQHGNNDTQWVETKKYFTYVVQQLKQSNTSSSSSVWESESPTLFQMFETTDFEHLMCIKNNLHKYEASVANDTSVKTNLKDKLDRFDPDSEIKRYARDVVNYDFSFLDNNNTSNRMPNDKQLRNNSDSTVLKNELMNSNFSNSTNNNNVTANTGSSNGIEDLPVEKDVPKLKNKKSSHRLRSKFGSLFGRKKENSNNSTSNGNSSKRDSIFRKVSADTSHESNVNTGNNRPNTQSTQSSRMSSYAEHHTPNTNENNSSNNNSSASKNNPYLASSNSSSTNNIYSHHTGSVVAAPQINNHIGSTGANISKSTTSNNNVASAIHSDSNTQPVLLPQRTPSTNNPLSVNHQPLSPIKIQHTNSSSEIYQNRSFVANNNPMNTNVNNNVNNNDNNNNTASYRQSSLFSGPDHLETVREAPSSEHATTGLVTQRNSSVNTNDNNVGTIQHSPNPPPMRKPSFKNIGNNRVTSQIFNNLNVADTANKSQSSILMPNMTGELQSLDPQTTGSSIGMLINSPTGFQHGSIGINSGTGYNSSNGLRCSVAEVVNASFVGGVLQSAQLIGEVALNYPINDANSNIPLDIGFKMVSYKYKPEKLIINRAFMQEEEEDEQANATQGRTAYAPFDKIYKVNPEFIISKTLGALKYTISSPDYIPPIVVHPIWKFEPHQASVVLTLYPSNRAADSGTIVLNNFCVFINIEGANTTTALSKPQGSFNKEKNRIAWRFNEPLEFGNNGKNNELKLIARFMTDGLAREGNKGVILRFNVSDTPNGNTGNDAFEFYYKQTTDDDPFGTLTKWDELNTNRTLVAGQYFGLA
ncbi:uncharacterized protein SCODWIG_01893 [Saccharomycodes ludwigii]|uniref:MHD domain-containing protein n=1 Tax=Saccharomycodes ludwigii TaxID=36035 RepID=A0A376B666_9ASCO|nr:uncharacterized protein SCODWIG_01893 [Saccharomycodes ludwigii]